MKRNMKAIRAEARKTVNRGYCRHGWFTARKGQNHWAVGNCLHRHAKAMARCNVVDIGEDVNSDIHEYIKRNWYAHTEFTTIHNFISFAHMMWKGIPISLELFKAEFNSIKHELAF